MEPINEIEIDIQVPLIFTGCQDPWHYNPEIELPACTNITEILGSYNQGPAALAIS